MTSGGGPGALPPSPGHSHGLAGAGRGCRARGTTPKSSLHIDHVPGGQSPPKDRGIYYYVVRLLGVGLGGWKEVC